MREWRRMYQSSRVHWVASFNHVSRILKRTRWIEGTEWGWKSMDSSMSPVRSGRNAGPPFIIKAQYRSRARTVKIARRTPPWPQRRRRRRHALFVFLSKSVGEKPVRIMEWTRFTLGSPGDSRKWDGVTWNWDHQRTIVRRMGRLRMYAIAEGDNSEEWMRQPLGEFTPFLIHQY